jgi:RNA-binding protein 15
MPYPGERYPPDPYLYPPPAGYPMDVPPYDPMMPPLHPGALPPPPMGHRFLPGMGRGRFMDFPGAERGGRGRGRKDRFPNYLQHIPPEDDPLACRTLFAGNLEVSSARNPARWQTGRGTR